MSTAVDNLTDTMAAASISDPTSTANTGNTNAAQNADVIASAAEGRRLYIGNLAYATTEGELKDFFKEYSVESTSIPVNPRTNRPVGYAFVDLTTAPEADRAISELSGKEILDRKVSVQLARNPAEKNEASGGEGSGGEGRKRGSGRGRGRGRGRGGRFGRGGRAEQNGETTETAAAPAAATETERAEPLADVTNQAPAAESAEGKKDFKPRAPRPHKQRGPPEDGVPSKTKVMVANLPYDLSEEKLKELFATYEPISAKIALRPIPRFMVKKLQARNEPRKGRGFGFVTLGSEAMQEKAVNEMNGKEIEGREIAVKVAIDSPGKEDDETAGTEQAKENGVTAEPAAETAAV